MTMILQLILQALCCTVFALVPYLLGKSIDFFVNSKRKSIPATYVTGFFLLLLIFEGVAIIAMKLDLSFSMLVALFSIIVVLICVAVMYVCKNKCVRPSFAWINYIRKQDSQTKFLLIFLLLLFIGQIGVSFHFSPIVQEDNTMEIVQTTLTTNEIYMNNAMTGQMSVNGIAMQGKFMALPLFYTFICRVFQMNPGILLYRIVPIWILMISYLVYLHLAQQIFRTEEDKPDSFKITVFILFYSALLLFGDFLFTTISYRIFHCAWTGETVVVAISLPFIISQLLLLKKQKFYSMLSVGICIVTVFFLVSLKKGITYLALTGIISLFVFLSTKARGGKICKNS